ncbi:universal stress protein [Paenibacillus piri]|uniref:Universal stress protein n=1 Tax=Paenibacillus piri TaxID=2547395 RepID=A0A4R5KY53_9BACL|nr:universal stress protein [Paenibacillus piri]TDG00767.1 universal stress protein [Paenibacillus piri]
MYRHILVPVDGSKPSLRALEAAHTMLGSQKEAGSLIVLYVQPNVTYNEVLVGINIEERLEEEGRAILKEAEQRLAGTAYKYRTLSAEGDPAKVICRVAEDEGFDLIVMGTRGMGLVKEMLLGSVSHGVIQHARCPVTLVK